MNIETASANGFGPSILLIFDLEGVAGVDEGFMVSANSPNYKEAVKHTTADVNAAIRGLKAGGAGAIWVQDGHGSGNHAKPDIAEDMLDKRARIDYRSALYSPYSTGINGSFDALVLIGMHAAPGPQGFVSHVMSPDIAKYELNGREVTETHIFAASAARWGIPIILVSGDDVLKTQIQNDFPDVEYVEVKRALSFAKAESLPLETARELIERGAEQAMLRFRAGQMRPFYLPPPYHFKLTWRNHEQASGAKRHPQVRGSGDLAVTFTTEDCAAGFDISTRLLDLAWDGFSVLRRLLTKSPEGQGMLKLWYQAMMQRIVDPDNAPDFAQPPAKPAGNHKHFGLS